MKDSGGRVVELVRSVRSQVHALGAGTSADPQEALRTLDRLENRVALLEKVAMDSFGEFEGRIRDLSMLRRLSDRIVSVFDLERVCDEMLEIAVDELHCDAGSLHLCESESSRLECRSVRGAFDSAGCDELMERCAQLSVERARTLRIDDALDDPDLAHLASDTPWRSLLASPIATLGRPLGVVVLAHAGPGRFGDEERRALAALADMAGLAIRHLLLTRDLAEQSELDTALRAPGTSLYGIRLELVRRERLAALAKLAAILAHEFNNPMSYVLSNLSRAREFAGEILERCEELVETAPPAAAMGQTLELVRELTEVLNEMGDGLGRVRRVAQELHCVGRGSNQSLELADVNAIVKNALQVVRGEAKPGIEFEERCKPVPEVRCSRLQLLQVLFHLLENAVDVLEGSGAVRVSTFCAGDRVRIEVADDGPGVPAERRERIFEPFFSTKPDGDGLGLAISRDIVRGHGGELSLDGEGERGAVFTISLPAAAEAQG